MRWLEHVRVRPITQARFYTALLLTVTSMTTLGCGGDDDPSHELTYCDVEPIFADPCQRCHGSPLAYGAPMELTSYEEVYQYRASIRSVVKDEYMPYLGSDISPPVEKLSEKEKALIVDWIDQGAADCP